MSKHDDSQSGQQEGTECVLHLMAEGGSLTLLSAPGQPPTFSVWLQDQCLEFVDEGMAISKRSQWVSFEQAIAMLDRYPWSKLYPRYIAPAYLDRIIAEVHMRATDLPRDVLDRWADATDACRTNDQSAPAPRRGVAES